MKAFITTGTKDFLEQHVQKYSMYNIHFMQAAAKTLVYYEHEHKNIFVSGRSYDVFATSGDILDEGFVVMEHIPVIPESRALFEDEWKMDARTFVDDSGCHAIRLLRPTKGNEYIIFTQWRNESVYNKWEASETYVQIQERIHKPAYFANRPFTNTYHMKEDDEEEE